MIVHLSAEAERDLEAIGDHIAEDSPARAIDFLQALRAKCLGLADMPERFPLVPRYEGAGVRHRVHGDYLIFYRVEPDRVTVTSAHVPETKSRNPVTLTASVEWPSPAPGG